MKFARVIKGVVIEIFREPQGFAIEECFTPELVATFEPCGEEVEVGWVRDELGDLVEPESNEP